MFFFFIVLSLPPSVLHWHHEDANLLSEYGPIQLYFLRKGIIYVSSFLLYVQEFGHYSRLSRLNILNGEQLWSYIGYLSTQRKAQSFFFFFPPLNSRSGWLSTEIYFSCSIPKLRDIRLSGLVINGLSPICRELLIIADFPQLNRFISIFGKIFLY